jgi:hypothetical protein
MSAEEATTVEEQPLIHCCFHCGKEDVPLFHCSNCMKAAYCGAECQKAGWELHADKCIPPLPTKDVWNKVKKASSAADWRGVLEWEGRIEALMHQMPDVHCAAVLETFVKASLMGMDATGLTSHGLAALGLEERRIQILKKMGRFEDQGQVMCNFAETCLLLSMRDAARLSTNPKR